MEPSQKITARRIGADVEVIGSFYEVPGLGVLPINSFLLRSAEPVWIDTGYVAAGPAYLDALCAAIDPRDLRWIWLTHADPDHVGALRAVLEAAPRARLVTTFLGLGKLGLSEPIPPARVRLLNPGQRLDVGDRELVAVRPATFDSPETTGAQDTETGTFFSADSFGAVLSAPALDAADVPASALRDGMITWATIDAPWLAWLRPDAFARELARVRSLGAPLVLSTHLPPARGITERLLDVLRDARTAPPWVGPDQAALEEMLARAPEGAPRVSAHARERGSADVGP